MNESQLMMYTLKGMLSEMPEDEQKQINDAIESVNKILSALPNEEQRAYVASFVSFSLAEEM
jgi:hypothetical protein